MARKKDSLAFAHPLVREWFTNQVGQPTEPQILGWPAIVAGKNTLISAPTGSGKTFAAFLACISSLVKRATSKKLKDCTEVLYVSPLKALSNDIHKNLTKPLGEIASLAKERKVAMSEIRVALRTGDTLAHERQAMLRKPPHILVTTPESLYILLTSEKSRVLLSSIKTVIVDEIHAIADDKRGAHLALSLERLEAITKKPPIRIGLSATQKPIEKVAAFLTGDTKRLPTIINIGHARHMDVAIEVAGQELASVASNELWDEIYDRVAALVNENRSTLVFVNTRRLAERVAHHLAERLGEENVAAHHGSLSRKIRLAAETKLKNGELKVLVATASLELGIDIGSVDLVCQLGSPRSIATALQRIGRAGHWHGAVSKGRLFATTRDELLECAALVYAIKTGDLDQLIIPDEPLDILAQQIVATCATGEWHENELFALVKKAYPYRHLSRDKFNSVIVMLSEGIAGSRGRYGTYLFRDQVNHIVKAKRGSRLTAITSGGAIPDNGLFTVIAEPNGTMVGTLDEDFAVESNRGDIILLGNTSWQIKRVEGAAGRVLVEDAHGAPPSVPFWRGEAPARTAELSLQVSVLRQKISDLLPDISTINIPNKTSAMVAGLNWLQENCGLDLSASEQLAEYVISGRALLGAVPTQETIIAERFFDEGGGMQLVIHAPFGARINKAWGLALRKRFCRSFNFELQAAATDDGLNISLAEQHSFPLMDVFQFLNPATIKEVLTQAVLQSPIFPTRWRWDASRALALVRFRYGKKVPPNIMRMRADDLLAAVFPDAAACQDNLAGKDIELPDHPLVNEAIKDALTEALDLPGLQNLLKKILSNQIQCLAIDTPTPSVFAHEILNANPYAYLDDAPLEERRARAVSMRRVLPPQLVKEIGRLDEAIIKEVAEQAWPDVRDADELHDVLQTFIALPIIMPETFIQSSIKNWQPFFTELNTANRATLADVNGHHYWVAAEKQNAFLTIYPQAKLLTNLPIINTTAQTYEDAVLNMLRGYLFHLGPTTSLELQTFLQLPKFDIDQALVKLETTGQILRGHFRNNTDSEEWCERRLLSRIHRLNLGKLRKEIEPVTAAQFMRWLLQWQHVTPETSLPAETGLLEIIKQLQGFELPANAWEKNIFRKRLKNYEAYQLDQLCLTGIVGWGRLTPHPAVLTDTEKNKRITPTSVAPITFFVREDAMWLPARININEAVTHLSHIAKSIYHYLQSKGASFFAEIVRGTDHLKAEVENGLWELVAAGLVTADGFDNLRAIIDPKRRLRKGRHRGRTMSGGGRWYLLNTDNEQEHETQLETICWVLLKRYGVVFRELISKEKMAPRWRELLLTFRRLEDRGEIRGGRFVSGFLGEQFALPYAIDSLRAIKKQPTKDEVIKLSAVDPLNLIGILLPGARISAISNKTIMLRDGEVAEDEATF